MTTEEFKTLKRTIAKDAVKYKRGKISGDELYETLYIAFGKETFEETEKLLDSIAE